MADSMAGNNQQPQQNRKILATGCFAHFIHDGFSDMLYVLLPIWQTQFALSFAEIGFLKTLFSGTLASFQVPAGLLANRVGAAKLLLIGTILTGCSVMLFGWATTPALLGCLLILGGLGESVQHPLSSALISNAYSDTKSRRVALSIFNVSGDVGKLVLPATAALLIAQLKWQSATQLLGLFGVVVAVVIFTINRSYHLSDVVVEDQVGKKKANLSSLKWSDNQTFWSLSTIGIIDSATRMGFLTFFPFLLRDKGAEITTIGLALSLIFAGGAAGKFVCGILATRLGILQTVIISEIMTAIAILSIINLSLSSVLLIAPILGLALNGTSSVLYGSVPELVSEENRNKAFAVFYTATIGSGAIAPFIYGLCSDFVGVKMTVVAISIIVLITIPLTMSLRGKLAH